MELKWFEDYLELVAARNFSTAATARSVSQSAFSRRINALENWVGAELIDRRTNPVTLTKAGEVFFPRCREILHDIYRTQTECQQRSDANRKLGINPRDGYLRFSAKGQRRSRVGKILEQRL